MKINSILLKQIRVAMLLLGVFVSWKTTLDAFFAFYRLEGTLFKVRDCVIPNPVTTPCFWGALAFFIALIWAYKQLGKEDKKTEKYFLYFMIASVIFAWSNFIIELIGVTPPEGSLIAPCPATASSPFLSACFFGSILFSFSLITTYLIVKKHNKKS